MWFADLRQDEEYAVAVGGRVVRATVSNVGLTESRAESTTHTSVWWIASNANFLHTWAKELELRTLRNSRHAAVSGRAESMVDRIVAEVVT